MYRNIDGSVLTTRNSSAKMRLTMKRLRFFSHPALHSICSKRIFCGSLSLKEYLKLIERDVALTFFLESIIRILGKYSSDVGGLAERAPLSDKLTFVRQRYSSLAPLRGHSQAEPVSAGPIFETCVQNSKVVPSLRSAKWVGRPAADESGHVFPSRYRCVILRPNPCQQAVVQALTKERMRVGNQVCKMESVMTWVQARMQARARSSRRVCVNAHTPECS